MAQNLAQSQPYENPQSTSPRQAATNPAIQAEPKRLPISGFEVFLASICGIVILCLALNIVYSRITITNAQHDLQTTQTRLSHVKNENASATQEISELTSRTRLDSVAKKNGLALTSQNIRNVSK